MHVCLSLLSLWTDTLPLVSKLPLQGAIRHLGRRLAANISNWSVCVCVCSRATQLLYHACPSPDTVRAPASCHACARVLTLLALARFTSSVIPPRPICLLSARLLCLLSFTPLRPPAPAPPLPSHLSVCICLIVSASVFTRQESPRQLLSICSPPPSFPAPSLKFKVLFSPPSVCATRVGFLFLHNIVSTLNCSPAVFNAC